AAMIFSTSIRLVGREEPPKVVVDNQSGSSNSLYDVLDEVDPNTLESKQCPGLYLAGEVLDVDARCGGYNLQWAWASGLLAGESAAGR
ncbi:MAG TPA: NAD(P)/FAD-dependent oxidoreductase, partial [Bacillota bacterium]|nr:NAD(P)/FAD-dependent oxidoreductase [Bacillota bacterium]